MTWKFFLQKFDWQVLFIVVALVGLSLMTFYHIGPSATGIMERQIVFLFIGIGLLILVSFFDYRILKNYSAASGVLYLISILLLSIVLFTERIRGVSSWLSLGGYTFEPSEIAKLGVIILLAKYFSQKHVNIRDFRYVIASGVYVLIPTLLTFIQPDLGSAVVFVMVWVVMLLASGIKRKHFMIIIISGLLVSSIAWVVVLKPYQKTRITTFLNPYLDPKGEGYSLIQSRTTVGSGQWFGTVIGNNEPIHQGSEETTVSLPVLVPEPYTDFTFAMFAQKFGLVGILILMTLFGLLVARVRTIVIVANNNFAKLFAIGFFTFIMTHVFINSGMNIGLLPITGIPFSFLSYGGSHLMTLMLGLGIIESIRLHS